MRILFVSRRMLVNLSLLGVVVCLVGVLKLLGGSPTVTAWVSAGLEAGQAPLFLAGNPQNQAVSLLVQLGAECDEQQLGKCCIFWRTIRPRPLFLCRVSWRKNSRSC